MSSNIKKSFLVYYDNEIIICRLSDDEAGKLFKSLFPYGRNRIRPDFESSPALAMAFDVLAMAIDRDTEKYEQRCEINRENGRRGGLAKANKCNQSLPNGKQGLANLADIDKDKEREKEKEIDISFSPLNLKEGNAVSPTADAGDTHPSLIDCKECADEGKVNLSEDGIVAFYERMEKDGWKIKGQPVENLLKAMRGFAKNHKRYQKEKPQPATKPHAIESEKLGWKDRIEQSIYQVAREYISEKLFNENIGGHHCLIGDYCPKEDFTEEQLEYMHDYWCIWPKKRESVKVDHNI